MSRPGFLHYVRDVPRQYRNMMRDNQRRLPAARASIADFLRGLRAKYVRRIP